MLAGGGQFDGAGDGLVVLALTREHLENVAGFIQLAIGKGHLEEMEPGVEVIRIESEGAMKCGAGAFAVAQAQFQIA